MSLLLKVLLLAALTLELASAQNNSWYPKYHLAPSKGWMNDPNGLSYHNGYYHAFYQYNPFYASWGPMHWGHARSKNMLSWEHLPIALTPSLPDDIDGIFSGSAVIKDNNLTVIYTGVSKNSTIQQQMVAVTTNGIDFEKLGVVLKRENGDEANFRDPKAWFQNNTWFVVIGSQTEDKRGEALLYKSPDFFNWTYEGVLAQADEKMGYMWECPDFFTLNKKQVLVINPQGLKPVGFDYQNLYQTGYYVGSWTPGSNYTIEKDFREIDHGHDFYASQTFVAPDGRRIMIGWMDMWQSAFPENATGWAGMFTLPRELTLTDSGRLEVRPIREVRNARKLIRNVDLSCFNLKSSGVPMAASKKLFASEVKLAFDLRNTNATEFGLSLQSDSTSLSAEGTRIYVNRTDSRLYVQRNYPQHNVTLSSRSVAISLSNRKLALDIFIDKSSIEVFVNDGKGVLSSRIYPDDDQRDLFIYGRSGDVALSYFNVYDF